MSDTWKLGVHVRPNNSDKTKDAQLIEIEWPVVSWLGNPDAFWWIEHYHWLHPFAKVLGRYVGSDGTLERFYKNAKPNQDATQIGIEYAHRLMAEGVPKWVYWRTDEMVNDYPWILAFNLAVMSVLIPAGYKWGGPMFSEGNPKQPPWDSVDEWIPMMPLFEKIHEYGPERALAIVNAYRADDYDPAHLTRFAHPYTLCEQRGLSKVYWAFAETGTEIPLLNQRPANQTGDQWQYTHALEINQKLTGYPKLIGGAWYDFSNLAETTPYRSYGYFFDLFVSKAKIMLAPTSTPPPPPPPAPPIIEVPPPDPEPTPEPEPLPLKVVTTRKTKVFWRPAKSYRGDRSHPAEVPSGEVLTATGEVKGEFTQVEAWIPTKNLKPQ